MAIYITQNVRLCGNLDAGNLDFVKLFTSTSYKIILKNPLNIKGANESQSQSILKLNQDSKYKINNIIMVMMEHEDCVGSRNSLQY